MLVTREREARRAEARAAGWADTHPYISAEYGCDVCGIGVDWMAEDLYEVFGRVPLSVDQARDLEHHCEWCRGGGELHRVHLYGFSLWAPGAGDDDDPLVEWTDVGGGQELDDDASDCQAEDAET